MNRIGGWTGGRIRHRRLSCRRAGICGRSRGRRHRGGILEEIRRAGVPRKSGDLIDGEKVLVGIGGEEERVGLPGRHLGEPLVEEPTPVGIVEPSPLRAEKPRACEERAALGAPGEFVAVGSELRVDLGLRVGLHAAGLDHPLEGLGKPGELRAAARGAGRGWRHRRMLKRRGRRPHGGTVGRGGPPGPRKGRKNRPEPPQTMPRTADRGAPEERRRAPERANGESTPADLKARIAALEADIRVRAAWEAALEKTVTDLKSELAEEREECAMTRTERDIAVKRLQRTSRRTADWTFRTPGRGGRTVYVRFDGPGAAHPGRPPEGRGDKAFNNAFFNALRCAAADAVI